NSRAICALPSLASCKTAASMNDRTAGLPRAAVPARPFQPAASSARKSPSAEMIAAGWAVGPIVPTAPAPRRGRRARRPLGLLARERLLDVVRTGIGRRELRARMARKCQALAAALDERSVERRCQWAVLRKQRQQHNSRQPAREVVEPGADHRLGRLAV